MVKIFAFLFYFFLLLCFLLFFPNLTFFHCNTFSFNLKMNKIHKHVFLWVPGGQKPFNVLWKKGKVLLFTERFLYFLLFDWWLLPRQQRTSAADAGSLRASALALIFYFLLGWEGLRVYVLVFPLSEWKHWKMWNSCSIIHIILTLLETQSLCITSNIMHIIFIFIVDCTRHEFKQSTKDLQFQDYIGHQVHVLWAN